MSSRGKDTRMAKEATDSVFLLWPKSLSARTKHRVVPKQIQPKKQLDMKATARNS